MGLPGRGLNGGREAKTASRKSPILSASLNIEGYARSHLQHSLGGYTEKVLFDVRNKTLSVGESGVSRDRVGKNRKYKLILKNF